MKDEKKTRCGVLSAIILILVGFIFWEMPNWQLNARNPFMQNLYSKIFALIFIVMAFIIVFFAGYYKAKRELK